MTNDIETEAAPEPLKPADFPSVKPEIVQDANAAIESEKAAKRKEREAKINARIAELKTFEGKTFARNDGAGLPVKVMAYIGILPDAKGGSYYAFTVEIPGHARWNPSATDFLNEHHVIDAPAETAINSEPK